jgi:hypothetical protein
MSTGARDSSDPQRAEIEIIASYPTEYGHSSRTVAAAFGEANAHVIAAAPDMLEALERFMADFEQDAADDRTAIVLARAAIAKAKGGAA